MRPKNEIFKWAWKFKNEYDLTTMRLFLDRFMTYSEVDVALTSQVHELVDQLNFLKMQLYRRDFRRWT